MAELQSLQGRVYAITGGSKGMGLRYARALNAEGAHVAILARPSAALDAVAAEIPEALALPCDVANLDDVKRAFAAIKDRHGKLDGLINNWTYQDYLHEGHLREYLREQGVDHIATPLMDHEPTYTGRPIEPMYREVFDPAATHGIDYGRHDYYVYSYVYHVYSDTIRLRATQEIFRRSLGHSAGADISYVIYRIGR